jgi:beta-1,4-mannosyltransferase
MKVLAYPAFSARETNPYTRLLYASMRADVADFTHRSALAARYDIFHVHWPEWELNCVANPVEAALRLRLKLALIDVMRRRGTKMIWTAHNLRAHEGLHRTIERWFWPAFTKRVDGYIALTESGRVAAREHFPTLKRVPGYVINHGHYRDEYSLGSTANVRKELGISESARVALFFGQIREYKNVPALIREFRKTNGDLVLCVAGKPNSEQLGEELRQAGADDSRVHLQLRTIPPENVQSLLRASDLVVLPYRDILNSGSAILALSFDRPILVPEKGAMGELREMVGPEWVRTFVGEITALELERSLEWATVTPRARQAPLDNLSWPTLAGQTLEAYEDVIATPARAKSSASSRSYPTNGGIESAFRSDQK